MLIRWALIRKLESEYPSGFYNRLLHKLHEYEAYLFADISQLSYFYNGAPAVQALQAIVDRLESPELIDDGPQTPPSKRIIHQFPQNQHEKTTVACRQQNVSASRRFALDAPFR